MNISRKYFDDAGNEVTLVKPLKWYQFGLRDWCWAMIVFCLLATVVADNLGSHYARRLEPSAFAVLLRRSNEYTNGVSAAALRRDRDD